MIEPAAESESDTPSPGRLVIRVKLIPPEAQPQPPAPRSSRIALLLILGAVALLLSWLGIRTFRQAPAVSTPPVASRTQESPVASNELPSKPATETVAPIPANAEAKSAQSELRQQPDAPPAAVNEVIPDVPKSALDTIRGTIRVSIRVTLDKQGTVIDTTADERGPSRYFERLAVDASKKWTFTQANLAERRTMLVRFNFTRAGVTAQASPPQ